MGDLQWNDVKQHLERNIFEQVCMYDVHVHSSKINCGLDADGLTLHTYCIETRAHPA